jgi:hypothetical protein
VEIRHTLNDPKEGVRLALLILPLALAGLLLAMVQVSEGVFVLLAFGCTEFFLVMMAICPAFVEANDRGVRVWRWWRVQRIGWSEVREIELRTLTLKYTLPLITLRGGEGTKPRELKFTMRTESDRPQSPVNQEPLVLAQKLQEVAKAAGHDVTLTTWQFKPPMPRVLTASSKPKS